MFILILSLVALCLVALVAGWLRNRSLQRKLQRGEISEMPTIQKSRPDGCCGKHAVCEKEQLITASTRPIEYFEDEELDAYRGRVSDSYTPSEEDDFEEVLSTMRPSEVADWVRSLQLRGVELPDELKDEVMMLIEG